MIAKLLLIGTLTVTSYRAIPAQTKPSCHDNTHCFTATGDTVSEQGVAVSQDLLESGIVHYGDVLYIDTVGYRICNDTMARRHKQSIDVFVYTFAEEKKMGIQHLKVWIIYSPQGGNKYAI